MANFVLFWDFVTVEVILNGVNSKSYSLVDVYPVITFGEFNWSLPISLWYSIYSIWFRYFANKVRNKHTYTTIMIVHFMTNNCEFVNEQNKTSLISLIYRVLCSSMKRSLSEMKCRRRFKHKLNLTSQKMLW